MDFAINNQQGMICHKTQPTNQPTNQNIFWGFQYDVYSDLYHIFAHGL